MSHKYLTPQQIVKCGKYPFTLGQIRHFLMNRKENKLEKCVSKLGKRVYFREDLFDMWVDYIMGSK